MHIDSYSFGHITVAGREYSADVIVFPDRVDASWRRLRGHNLLPKDLEGVIRFEPDGLIIGCGDSGALKVPAATIAYLEDLGIKVHVARTANAINLFNSLPKCKRIVAALHLTC